MGNLPVKASVEPGDNGRDYAQTVVGEVTVTVYEHVTSDGSTYVVVDVDADEAFALKITVNDDTVFEEL